MFRQPAKPAARRQLAVILAHRQVSGRRRRRTGTTTSIGDLSILHGRAGGSGIDGASAVAAIASGATMGSELFL